MGLTTTECDMKVFLVLDVLGLSHRMPTILPIITLHQVGIVGWRLCRENEPNPITKLLANFLAVIFRHILPVKSGRGWPLDLEALAAFPCFLQRRRP